VKGQKYQSEKHSSPMVIYNTATRQLEVLTRETLQKQFLIIGHQGGRGTMPGNTIHAFMHALKTGINAIELDVMMSADGELVVTDHAALTPLHYYHPFIKEEQLVYDLTVAELQEYDCGKKFNSSYPFRKNISSTIPLLKDVFSRMEKYVLWNNIRPAKYFIDIKTSPSTDNLYHPKPEEFIVKLTDLIRTLNIGRRCTVISSDVRPLQLMRRLNQHVTIGLKVENEESIEDNIEALGFLPGIYMPEHVAADRETVFAVQSKGMKIIPIGANDLLDMNEMLSMGVDGLITDYPQHAAKLVEE
jgi:glycerophosphoryl diester phosphodiesterase